MRLRLRLFRFVWDCLGLFSPLLVERIPGDEILPATFPGKKNWAQYKDVAKFS